MGLNVGMTQKLGVAGVVLYITLRSVNVFSADAPTATGSSPVVLGGTQSVGSQLPSTFDAGIFANTANMFSNVNGCVNLEGQLNQAKDIIINGTKATQAAVNPNAECGSFDEMGELPQECRAFGRTQEQMSKKFDEWLARADKVKETAVCRKTKLDSLNAQLSCLYTQAGALKAQINALNDSYKNNIQKMETDYAQIKAVEEDRNSQLEFLNARLNGDKESGKKGVRQLAAETKEMINRMNADIQAAKEKFTAIDQEKAREEELTVNRTMELTNACFSAKSNSSFRCEPNGPPVSARDYVLCRFEQNQRLGEKGAIEQNASVAAEARAKRAALENLLNSVLGDSAQMNSAMSPPGANGQQGPAIDKPVTIRSYEELKNQIGDKLTSYNGKGLDIQAFVLNQYKGCYTRSKSTVVSEKSQNNTALGRMRNQLNSDSRTAAAYVNGLLETYSQQYNENISGLTGANLPVDATKCKNATPERQANCLSEMQKNMEGLYNGTSTNSQMAIKLSARDPNLQSTLNCTGIQGCLTVLENAFTGVKKEKERVTKFKTDYALRAKQNVQNFTSTMAKTLSGQSAELRSKLQSMNNVLKQLSLKPLRIKDVESEQMELDEESKLPKVPKNVMGLIGGQMNPKMPDLDGDQFKEELDQVTQEGQKFEQKVAKAAGARTKLEKMKAECQDELEEKRLQVAEKGIENMERCFQSKDYCDPLVKKDSRYLNDIESVRDLLTTMGSEFSDYSDLSARFSDGVQITCPKTVKAAEAREAAISKADDNARAMASAQGNETGESAPRCASIVQGIKKSLTEGGGRRNRGGEGSSEAGRAN